MGLQKILLNGILAISLAVTPTAGFSVAPDPYTPDPQSSKGVTDSELEFLDEALQKEYQALLNMGYQPSEADQILRREFEAHGCNGDVAVDAIIREPSLQDQIDPEKKRTKRFLKETYQGVDFSARCAAAIEVARGIDAGVINQTNFLPEDLFPGMKDDPDRMAVIWPIIQAVIYIAGVASTVHWGYSLYDDHKNPELEKLQARYESAAEDLGKAATRVATEIHEYGQATGEALYRFDEAAKRYLEAERARDQKRDEVRKALGEPPINREHRTPPEDQKEKSVKEQSGETSPTKDPSPEVERPEKQKKPEEDQGGVTDVCEICAERERDAKWQQFQKQVVDDVNTCLNREPVPDSPLTRIMMPRTTEADLAGAKTCDGKQLIKSLRESETNRAQRVCRFSVETETECFQRIEEQRKRNMMQDFEETDGEILRVDCKLLTYPAQWHKQHAPLQSVEDCLHLQKTVSRNSSTYEARLAQQDFMRPYTLLAGEKCYAAALNEEAPPRKDPKSPSTTGNFPQMGAENPQMKNPGLELEAENLVNEAKKIYSEAETLRNSPLPPDAYIPAQIFVETGSDHSSSMRTVHVQGTGLISYKYKQGPAPLDCADPNGYSLEIPIGSPFRVILFNYPDHVDHQICVVGRSEYSWQPLKQATHYTWKASNSDSAYTNRTDEVENRPFTPIKISTLSDRAAAEYERVMRDPKATAEEKCIARQKLEAAIEIEERQSQPDKLYDANPDFGDDSKPEVDPRFDEDPLE